MTKNTKAPFESRVYTQVKIGAALLVVVLTARLVMLSSGIGYSPRYAVVAGGISLLLSVGVIALRTPYGVPPSAARRAAYFVLTISVFGCVTVSLFGPLLGIG